MNTNITRNKTLLVSIIAVMLAAIFSFTLAACNTHNSTNESAEIIQESEYINDFSTETVNTPYLKLAMGPAVMTAGTGSVSKTITATVLPETASNKAVDWSVEWGDSSSTGIVTDYVTVTPDFDGSTSATVTCYQEFSGTILVTVTTRESGYSASCVVTFVGIPTEIIISGAVNPVSGNTYALGIGSTFSFNVDLTNPFNSVGSAYNNVTCTLTGVGSINVGYMEHYNTSGADVWFDNANKTLTIDSLKNNFITANYSDGILTVTTIKSIESYYATRTRLDSGRTWGYNDKFRSYVDDCYFTVKLTETTSGISKTIIIRFDDSIVTGINTNLNEMFF
jgi:hypothetical protein